MIGSCSARFMVWFQGNNPLHLAQELNEIF